MKTKITNRSGIESCRSKRKGSFLFSLIMFCNETIKDKKKSCELVRQNKKLNFRWKTFE